MRWLWPLLFSKFNCFGNLSNINGARSLMFGKEYYSLLIVRNLGHIMNYYINLHN